MSQLTRHLRHTQCVNWSLARVRWKWVGEWLRTYSVLTEWNGKEKSPFLWRMLQVHAPVPGPEAVQDEEDMHDAVSTDTDDDTDEGYECASSESSESSESGYDADIESDQKMTVG